MLRKTPFLLVLLTIVSNSVPAMAKGGLSARSHTVGPGKERPIAAIRAIPWQDRTYDFGDGEPCKFSEGNYSDLNDEGRCNVCMHIRAVTFGDIDGDGQEEALVTVATNLGGAGVLLEGFIYALEDGVVVLRAEVERGDRGDGGIESMKVTDGDVVVRRFRVENPNVHDPDQYGSTCCPNWIELERWHWDGNKLVKVGDRFIRRAPTPWTGPRRRGRR